jgi:serine/threonine protein phosphatase PrpC
MYLVRDNRIERMSKDHTIVAEHVEMGVMTEEGGAITSQAYPDKKPGVFGKRGRRGFRN